MTRSLSIVNAGALEQLRLEFLDLFTLHKEMVENEFYILNSLYIQKLGYLQMELFKVQAEAARLKTKLNLIQAAINRSEQPDLRQIEQQVEQKMKIHYEKIAEQAKALEASKSVLTNLLSEEDSLNLRETFRVLCKRPHPDLNPNQGEQEKDLFVKVKAAYDLKDIKGLQTILLYLDDSQKEDLTKLTQSERERRIKVLEDNIAALKEKIEKLRQSFPFNIEKQITDEEYILRKQAEIREQCRVAQEEADHYQKLIRLILDE